MRDNMSTALVSAFYEVSDVLYNNYKNPPPTTLKLDKRAVGTPISGVVRRHSTSSTSITVTHHNSNANDTRLRDRAMSERAMSENDRQSRTQTSRYKTELCRPFEEHGTCKYGDKCQFAHGMNELRNLSRHPKYKSELCRTFHTVGFCPYGPRCHFIHNPEERKLGLAAERAKQQQQQHRDRTVERPKLLHFLSAPLGSTGGGDLTPVSDSPISMTPPPSIYGDDVFFSSDNLNDYSRNTFRPPSPPDSLSDPESISDSVGPASPTPISSTSKFNRTMSAPVVQPPTIYTSSTRSNPKTSTSPSTNSRVCRLPIFRGMSLEERFGF